MWADVLPLLVFFWCSKKYDIYVATLSAIVFSVLGTLYKYKKHGKVDSLPLFGTALMVVFGGLTVYFKNPQFLFWKPTLAYAATAAFFAYSCRDGQQPLVERLFQSSLQLNQQQWRNATWAYVGFFIFKAILNLLVAYNFSLEFWVRYKVFGTIILSLGFMVGHAMWLQGRQQPQAATQSPSPE